MSTRTTEAASPVAVVLGALLALVLARGLLKAGGLLVLAGVVLVTVLVLAGGVLALRLVLG